MIFPNRLSCRNAASFLNCFPFLLQALEASDWIERTSRASSADVVVYAGDLNTERGDLPWRVLTQLGRMNAYEGREEESSVASYGDAGNSYSGGEGKYRPVMIDHVLHRGRRRRRRGLGWKTETARVWKPMPCKVPGRPFR